MKGRFNQACKHAMFGVALLWSTLGYAERGISPTEIRIGMANALTGPAAGLGTQLKAGASAYLDKINAAGGVHGRKVVLVSRDDGYEPDKTVAATKKLIEVDQVFALFGYVGTPTSTAVLPMIGKAQVPYLFPFTGAEFLRTPVNRWVFNVRASYFDETERLVERLTADLQIKNIAVFIQDDAFGAAGKGGVLRALQQRGLKLTCEAKYRRNTVEIEEGLDVIKAQEPQAVIFIGTYKPFAALLKKARHAGVKAQFLTVSFIGTSEFIEEAGLEGNGVVISQVMPSPEESQLPLVQSYRTDMEGKHVNYTTMEGYVNAMVLVQALQKLGPEPTRAALVSVLESSQFDLGGMKVGFSPLSHQGTQQVFLTRVEGSRAVPIERLEH